MTKTNLLFIFTDEQALNTLGTYGNNRIETPNLDRLARESTVFERAYVTQPVCTPSRSSLMTGLYPHTSGCTENNIPLDRNIPCLPEMGDFSAYKTAYHGKWHLGDEVFAQHGFEEWRSIEDGYHRHFSRDRDQTRHSTYADFLIEEGFKPTFTTDSGLKGFNRDFVAHLPEEYSKPAYLARESSRFIRENRENPFMLFVNFLEPHMPYFGPRDDQYDPEDIPLPASFDHEFDENTPLKLRLFRRGYYENGHSGMPLKTEDDWRQLISNYWGLASQVDTHVGTILDTLEDCGLKEDTIIVFTSDHGDMMGAHRLLAKCVMYEEAVRVPLFIRIPGRRPERISAPVSQVDLVPTLLQALEQPVPEELDGFSWWDHLQEGTALPEENVFIEWNGPNNGFGGILDCWHTMASEDEIRAAITDPVRTVITPEGWKYNMSPRGEDELYNLEADPHEEENLAPRKEYAGIIDELTKLIRDWQLKTGDCPEDTNR